MLTRTGNFVFINGPLIKLLGIVVRWEVPRERTVSCHRNVRADVGDFSTYGMSVSYVGYLLFSTYRRDLREPSGKCAPPPTVERFFHFLLTEPMPTT